MTFQLVKPSLEYLPGAKAALEQGWGPDNMRQAESSRENLQKIIENPEAFVKSQNELDAKGGQMILPDGSAVPRLPGFRRWMWDGEFCGSISFRWQPGTTALPEYVSGHIGYSVVPWKRGRHYATQALHMLLEEIKGFDGLDHVDITTDPDNIASQRVILSNSGVPEGEFTRPLFHHSAKGLRFRINL